MTNPEKDPIDELEDDLREVGRGINNFARSVAKKVEDTYDTADEKFKLQDRFIGATAGAKAAGILGLKAGPIIAAKAAVLGAVAGFAVGDKGVEKYRNWRDGDKEDEATEVANDDDQTVVDKQDAETVDLSEGHQTNGQGEPPSPKDGP